MLKRILIIICFQGIAAITLAQDGSTPARISIKGIVYDSQSMERVPFVHIIDIKHSKGANADDRGNFSFSASSGDSIKFTAVGYEDFFLIVNDTLMDKYITIRIAPKTYMLETLDFYATDPMKGFYLKDVAVDTIRLGSSKGMPGAEYWNGTPGAGTGYITAFANLFNRHHKQEKKMAEIQAEEQQKRMIALEQEKKQQKINEKYTIELVQQITELEGDELDRFLAMYRPSENFILNSSKYEIAVQIVNAYRNYRYENGLEVDVSEILKRAKFKDY